jgi:hemolysin activation/secretion protein
MGSKYLSPCFSRHCAIFIIFLAAGLLAESPPALAFTPTQLQDAQQQNDKIQREQQIQQQQDIDNSLNTGRPQSNIQVPAPSLQKGKGEGCRKIKRIMLVDATHMSEKEKAALIAPYAGKCLGVDDIEKLMSDVTSFYIKKGFVTTRVYLPAQDLSKGRLKVQIVPGKVSEIKTDESKTRINYLGNLFPDVEDHDLNLRDFEQGIDQINRLLSNNATIDIQPGEKAGDSIVTINNKPTAPWHLNSTFDNYGAQNTGRDQVGLTASFDNLAGLEDFTSLGLHKSLPLNDPGKQATSDNILISIPMGYSTLTMNYNQSDYDSTTQSGPTNLHLNGTEDTATVTLDHVVYRDQTSKASVNVALANDITDTYIDNQFITESSRILTYATFGGNYSTQIKGGSATLGIGYTRGLHGLDALSDPADLNSSVPHAQFDKYTLTAGYVRPFSYDQQNFSFSSQFSGQYAPYALYGSQQFSLGGIYTVRGFINEALANDDGYYLRNDLTLLKTANVDGRVVNIRPLVALDVGSAGSVHPGTQDGTLVGAAAGTDIACGPFDFNILGGHPVVRPDAVPDPGFNILSRLAVTF